MTKYLYTIKAWNNFQRDRGTKGLDDIGTIEITVKAYDEAEAFVKVGELCKRENYYLLSIKEI